MSDAQITIRTGTLEDAVAIAEFNCAIASETEGVLLCPETVRSGVEQGLSDPHKAIYFLAECGGAIAGQSMVTLEWSDWRNGNFWWIQSVYVQPEFRRQGVFRRLYKHIREQARSRPDVCGLRLYVHKRNDRAMATYGILGMTVSDYLICAEDWSGAAQSVPD